MKVETADGFGTGVIVGADGTVLTANHVVDGEASITVVDHAGTEHSASLVSWYPYGDLARLSVPTLAGASAVSLAEPGTPRPGGSVLKIGYGGTGDVASVSAGLISAIHPADRVYPEQMQTDAPINPGDSGGPLLNEFGELLALSVSKIAAVTVEGVAFGTTVDTSSSPIRDLLDGEGLVCGPAPATKDVTFIGGYGAWIADVPATLSNASWSGFEVFWSDQYSYNSLYGEVIFYAYSPFLADRSGPELMDALVASRADPASSDPEVVTYLVQPREICHDAGKVHEAEIYAYDPTPFGLVGNASRERWMTINTGDTLYLIVGAAWPDLFMHWEEHLDTILYSFRFRNQ